MAWGSGGKRVSDAAGRASEAADYIEEKEPLINKFTDEQENLQAQVDKLVVEGDSSPAAAQASVGADATVYPTLKARLDAENKSITTQLADTAKRSEVQSLVVNKAERQEVELLSAKVSEKAKQSDLEIERARISNLTANAGNTEDNAELLDIRIGFDGEIYPTAGDATRAIGNYMTDENATWEVI